MELDFSERLKQAIEEVNRKKEELSTIEEIKPWMDPRALDLSNDSIYWIDLMKLVSKYDELWSMLDTVRCAGAVLVRDHRTFRIKPIIDETGKRGWESMSEYDKAKEQLMKFQVTLTAALLELFKQHPIR